MSDHSISLDGPIITTVYTPTTTKTGYVSMADYKLLVIYDEEEAYYSSLNVYGELWPYRKDAKITKNADLSKIFLTDKSGKRKIELFRNYK